MTGKKGTVMDYEGFAPDQLVYVFNGKLRWLGVLKHLDADECWIEILDGRGPLWKMAKVLIQRHGCPQFSVEEVPGVRGQERYLTRIALGDYADDAGKRRGAIALISDQGMIAEIVRNVKESESDSMSGKRPLYESALKKITDIKCLEEIIADESLAKEIRKLAMDRLTSISAGEL